MKCVIPSLNIKVFARAIHSLSRVGDDLYVEPSSNGVAFRTVNSSRSAFGSFFFHSNFFSMFDFKVPEADHESFKCKVVMKAFLNPFKSVNSIEKVVEKCRLVIDSDEDRLVISMSCRHGVHKKYNLTFIECETLQAMFDKERCSHNLRGQSRILLEAFGNFQMGQEEVVLSSSSERVLLRNYLDDEPDPSQAIHTELQLENDEFDEYSIESDCEITFCLKEVRSLLSFSEPMNLPVFIRFSNPGSPIIFSVENDPIFEANFVLATLSSAPVRETIVNTDLPNGSQCTEIKAKKSSVSGTENNPFRDSEKIDDCHFNESLINCWNNGTDKLPIAKGSTTTDNNIRKTQIPKPKNMVSSETINENRDVGDVEEILPSTPPAKKRRFFFQRCFEPTFDASAFLAFQNVLAEDSDEDS